jgi:hypothetical protein
MYFEIRIDCEICEEFIEHEASTNLLNRTHKYLESRSINPDKNRAINHRQIIGLIYTCEIKLSNRYSINWVQKEMFFKVNEWISYWEILEIERIYDKLQNWNMENLWSIIIIVIWRKEYQDFKKAAYYLIQ